MASGIAIALQVGVNYRYCFRNLELPLPFVVQKCYPPHLRHEFSRFLSEIGSDILEQNCSYAWLHILHICAYPPYSVLGATGAIFKEVMDWNQRLDGHLKQRALSEETAPEKINYRS
ncbi:Uncharacterized protein Adt_04389 [Abeliophyllum distichum]|uniref:Uncharacterized protein n=1 Tax=Abeliophyllum distichum TaxID=126358 RepID=A0ABD1W1M6_9LAMI